jgi:steroid delta-isomerase-like uncharacterized protein
MTTEHNKALVRRFFEEVFNQGRLELVDSLFAPGFTGRGLAGHGGGGPGRVKQTVQHWRAAFPDIRFTVEEMIAEGNNVVVRVTFRGTQQGEFMGVAASGRPVAVSGVEVARVVDGLIAEEGWHYLDELGLMRQLGALPAHRA